MQENQLIFANIRWFTFTHETLQICCPCVLCSSRIFNDLVYPQKESNEPKPLALYPLDCVDLYVRNLVY